MNKYFLNSILVIFISLLSLCQVFAQTPLPGRMVARIPHGSREGELGVTWKQGEHPYNESVNGICVDEFGSIYFLDYVNGKIKKFSKDGELLSLTPGKYSDIHSFTVDDTGAIYMQSGRPGCITKFGVNEQIVWSHSFAEIFPLTELRKTEKQFGVSIFEQFNRLLKGRNNTVIIEIKGLDNITRKHRYFSLVMDADGKFVSISPPLKLFANDYFITYDASVAANDNTLPSVTVSTYSMDGKLHNTFPLDIKADDGVHYKGYSYTGGILVLPDQRGGVITITSGHLPRAVAITPTVSTNYEFILNRYDSNGKFLEEIRFIDSPFMGSRNNIAISHNGCVFYLQFDKQFVYIWSFDKR